MLTVWRKLHVELDSMDTLTGNHVAGTVLETIDLAPQPKVKLKIPGLPADFREADHFNPGKIHVIDFGVFSTRGTELEDGGDWIVVENPESLDFTGAVGETFILEDDDIQLPGLPPPVSLPRLPDSGLMPEVYGEAYIAMELLDQPPYAQFDILFDRNVRQQADAYALIDNSKNVDSAAGYWAAHVVSAFQGYVARDGDPGSEEGSGDGLLYGVTKVETDYLFLLHYGGSVVFLETCRDKGASESQAILVEQFVVAHEVGHQFKLEHSDGDEDPPGSGTYLMKTSEYDLFPDNLRFSPKSLKKTREIDWPQKE